MSAQRTDMHRLQDLVRLHRLGHSAKTVARLLSMSPNTERKYRNALLAEHLLKGDSDDLPSMDVLKAAVLRQLPSKSPPQQLSTAAPYKERILSLHQAGAGPKAIFDRLKLDHADDFEVSYSAVKRMIRSFKRQAEPQPSDVVVPVQTEPGLIGQVDFGSVGKLLDPATGTKRQAHAFVMVLGHSRHMFAKLVFDQTTETWLQCHLDAFAYFGGVPRIIVPDNLKAAVIRRAFGREQNTELNRSYRHLARQLGFIVDPTPPRSPEKKGKVERSILYIKSNFFATLTTDLVVEAQQQLHRWVVAIAGQRVHGTTGQAPLELFEQVEKKALMPYRPGSFELLTWHQGTVHNDFHVQFQGRFYSVPWQLAGHKVWLCVGRHTIAIYDQDEVVALHDRHGEELFSTLESHVPQIRARHRHRDPAWWKRRAAELDPTLGQYIEAVFETAEPLSVVDRVAAMMLLLEKAELDVARSACERALLFGNLTYSCLKTLLAEGQGEVTVAEQMCGRLAQPKFARSVTELLAGHNEEGG